MEDCRLADGTGWSVDLQDPNIHISLSAHDFVFDPISLLEYSPGFRINFCPSLLSLKPNHKLATKELRAFSE